jgi:recombination endonuclease VII
MDDEDPEEKKRRYQREWQKTRYANDPEYRERKLSSARAYKEANREKWNASVRRRYADDGEFRAKRIASEVKFRLKRYGISAAEFEAILARQHGACGICERPFQHTPHIDHDHATHTVRGLLCSMCNLGLGHFEDNPTFLRNAARYLERWRRQISESHNQEGDNMPANNERNGAVLIRKMLLHELHQPHGVDLPAPTDRLQAIVRGLVTQAAEARDLHAIREVLDRVAGPPPLSAA